MRRVLLLLWSYTVFGVVCTGSVKAAGPPFPDPELWDEPWQPPGHPFDAQETFKAAVVGGRLLWHHRESSSVITQTLPLSGPARPKAYYLPPVPYPGRTTPQAGLTCTALSYGFPLRWHATKDSFYIAEAYHVGVGDDRLRRYPLDGLLVGKVKPRSEAVFTDNGPGWTALLLMPGSRFEAELFHDYLPDGDDGALQLVLTNTRGRVVSKGSTGLVGAYSIIMTEEERNNPRWSFTLHRCKSRLDVKRGVWEPGAWEKVGDLPVAFKEPFHALQKGDALFLLTASGRLFVSPAPAKGEKRKITHVIGDARRPVEGIITAPKEGKTYLFVKSADRKGPAFFELSDKPKLEFYDPKAAKVPEGEKALGQIMHKARVLVALGRLKGK
jgi:hypothetical protein